MHNFGGMQQLIEKKINLFKLKLDGVIPVDNTPSIDELQHVHMHHPFKLIIGSYLVPMTPHGHQNILSPTIYA